MGGKRLDQSFLADLPAAPGMQIGLYSDTDNLTTTRESEHRSECSCADGLRSQAACSEPNGDVRRRGALSDADRSRAHDGPAGERHCVSDRPRREDSVNATAIPLKNESGQRAGGADGGHLRAAAWWRRSSTFAPLPMAWRRAEFCWRSHSACGLRRGFRGPLSSWRTQRKKWRAATGMRAWPERGRDEVSVLARSFNHMTEQLAQPARAAGAERTRGRVARTGAAAGARAQESALSAATDGRESGAGARFVAEAEFDEVFRESTATLGMEIANLKTIIGRFSDFSKMPKPELERIDAKDVVERVRSLYETARRSREREDQDLISMSPMSRCRSMPIRSCCIARCRTWC